MKPQRMTPEQFWKNSSLLDAVSIAGAFVYNGLRRFHEMQMLEHTDEIFEFFYNLSVGIERLLKVAVVLLERLCCIDRLKSQERKCRSDNSFHERWVSGGSEAVSEWFQTQVPSIADSERQRLP